ncbi:MAG: hypothetical protein ACYDHC_05980 [Desulfuromonadaceae bacterium]
MACAKIVAPPKNNLGFIPTTIKNTGITQRETLEEIIINLATIIGAKEIYKTQDARGSYLYVVQAQGFSCFQSASNTILELSRKLSVTSY